MIIAAEGSCCRAAAAQTLAATGHEDGVPALLDALTSNQVMIGHPRVLVADRADILDLVVCRHHAYLRALRGAGGSASSTSRGNPRALRLVRCATRPRSTSYAIPLIAIHSRLGTIEGKVTLVARADRKRILAVLREVVQKAPLVGQIYLLLDGSRGQRQIRDELARHGVERHEATISRRIEEMFTEHGIADLVRAGQMMVYRKNREIEDVLNLTKNVRAWLEEGGHAIPLAPAPRRRRSS